MIISISSDDEPKMSHNGNVESQLYTDAWHSSVQGGFCIQILESYLWQKSSSDERWYFTLLNVEGFPDLIFFLETGKRLLKNN